MKIFPSTTVVITTVSGGGESTAVHTIFLEKDAPSSYATGGIAIDLSSTFSSILSADIKVVKGTRSANLPYGQFIYTVSGGILTVKIMKYFYTRVTSFDTINSGSQPSGVTIQAASGSTSSSESAHTHDASHNHAAQASAAMTAGGTGVSGNALAAAIETHTHSVDLPNLTLTSGAGSSHNHTDNTLYSHTHALTYTVTNVSTAELTNATSLSGMLFSLRVTGARA